MKKELYNRKLELFKQLGEVKISKKGNHYIRYNHVTQVKKINVYSMHSITTRTHSKINSKEIELTRTQGHTVLFTKTGVIKVKFGNSWYGVKRKSRYTRHINSIKDGLTEKLLEISFLGKKYEYLHKYQNLLNFNLAYDFKSLEDFKEYLGYKDISEKKFIDLIEHYPEIAINGVLFPGETLESIKINLNLRESLSLRTSFDTTFYKLFLKVLEIKQRLEIPVKKEEIQRLAGILLDRYIPEQMTYTTVDTPF